MHFWQFYMVQMNIIYTYSPNTDIYFLHTSKKISVRPYRYESFKK
jgi:hypothetical protein